MLDPNLLDPNQTLAVEITAALYVLGLAVAGALWATLPWTRRWMNTLLGGDLDGDA